MQALTCQVYWMERVKIAGMVNTSQKEVEKYLINKGIKVTKFKDIFSVFTNSYYLPISLI